MSWIEDIERMIKLECGTCGCVYKLRLGSIKIEQHEDHATCPDCGARGNSKYRGFENVDPIGLTKNLKRSTYDQNGRKAIRIGDTYMSKSKHHYLETGKVQEFNTREYDEHTIKQSEEFKKGAGL